VTTYGSMAAEGAGNQGEEHDLLDDVGPVRISPVDERARDAVIAEAIELGTAHLQCGSFKEPLWNPPVHRDCLFRFLRFRYRKQASVQTNDIGSQRPGSVGGLPRAGGAVRFRTLSLME
jgi:hypothetical protein